VRRSFSRTIIKTGCLPILLYGLEVCPLSKTNLRSLDFPINRFFMKLFNTSDMQIVRNASRYSTSDCLARLFLIGVRHFAESTSLAMTR